MKLYQKQRIRCFSLIVYFLFSAVLVIKAQQRIQFKATQTANLLRFSQLKKGQFHLQKQRADSFAIKWQLPISYIDTNHTVIHLQRLGRYNKPIYYATNNITAARIITADKLWYDTDSVSFISGADVTVGMWDGGGILTTHNELQSSNQNRTVMVDKDATLANHSTHIAGTILATGADPLAKGMASQAKIMAWDLNNDVAEMAMMAAEGMALSNHSYGWLCGWYYYTINDQWYWYGDIAVSQKEDFQFGFYNNVSADLDSLACMAPQYLMVKSAGNNRGDGPLEQPIKHLVWDEIWHEVSVTREIDGGTDGYDCLTPMAVAKNVLTVGAVDDAVNMATFSGWGPTDDGRIKPDVVANGTTVYSCLATADNSYGSYNGTSMSTASVTGSIALLQHYQQILQPEVTLLSSTTKGLVIHTANTPQNQGPNYQWGWGVVDINAAAQVLQLNCSTGGQIIGEWLLRNNESLTLQVDVANATKQLKATLCWTDPAAIPTDEALNDRTSKLVNDLDLAIINDTNHTTYYPWVLNAETPEMPAEKAPNHTDNVEQILITDPEPGSYTLRITYSGASLVQPQSFSLIVTGGVHVTELYPPKNLTYKQTGEVIQLQWQKTLQPVAGYEIYKNEKCVALTEDTLWCDSMAIINRASNYHVKAIYLSNSDTLRSLPTNTIFVTPSAILPLPFFENFESDTVSLLLKHSANGWRWGDSDSLSSYYLRFQGNDTKFIAASSFDAGEIQHVYDVAVTPLLRLGEYKNIELSFDYMLVSGLYGSVDQLNVVCEKPSDATWQIIKRLDAAFNWTNVLIELDDSICENGLTLGFLYDDGYQWGMGAAVDNISITGTAIRRVDWGIESYNSPSSACGLSDAELVEVVVINVGTQSALPGDSIWFNLSDASQQITSELLVLRDTFISKDKLVFSFSQRVDVVDSGWYNYTVDIHSVIDVETLNNSLSWEVANFPLPDVAIQTSGQQLCVDAASLKIDATPVGGSLSGSGIEAGSFYPDLAGVGKHIISYSVVNEHGCTASDDIEIGVLALPDVAIQTPGQQLCVDAASLKIDAIPVGGSLSGSGIEAGRFYPDLAGVGRHVISYSVVNEHGCTASDDIEIEVLALPDVAIQTPGQQLCVDAASLKIDATPVGGSLSGSGIEAGRFYPDLAGVGRHVISYSVVNEHGCTASDDIEIEVLALPDVAIQTPVQQLCVDAASLKIDATPVGGSLSGSGIEAGSFYPDLAGVGKHIISYSVVNDHGCTASDDIEIEVLALPDVAIQTPGQQLCVDAASLKIDAIPVGGSLSGSGIEAGRFYPDLAGVGRHVISYSVVNEHGCTASDDIEIEVLALPDVAIQTSGQQLCVDAASVKIDATPEGGSLSGSGIEAGSFYPDLAGVGKHIISYSVVNEHGCTASDDIEIEVLALPDVAIQTPGQQLCVDAASVKIDATPEGGSLSGSGIEAGRFYPDLAGVGRHVISYSVVNEHGCTASDDIEIEVLALPDVAIQTSGQQLCVDAASLKIDATPEGGSLSGSGIEAGRFYPDLAGVGRHVISYSVVNEHGCTASDDIEIEVLALPDVAIQTSGQQLCVDAASLKIDATPEGGSLSGSGIEAGRFYPDLAGVGRHVISYSVVNEHGCTASDDIEIEVLALPDVAIQTSGQQLCVDAASLKIDATPEGGSLSGSGIEAGRFYPDLAGVGRHVISYSVVNEHGCTASDDIEIEVLALPDVAIQTSGQQLCVDAASLKIDATPEGGSLSGSGIEAGRFYPDLAGVGRHVISYSVVNEHGCTASDDIEIEVQQVTIVSLGNDTMLTLDDTLQYCYPDNASELKWCDGSRGRYFTLYANEWGSGLHHVWLMVEKGGCITVDTVKIVVQPLIVDSAIADLPPILIYPNPFKHGVYIVSNSNSYPIVADIYDITGRQIATTNISERGYLTLEYLPEGIYLLKVFADNRCYTYYLIKN